MKDEDYISVIDASAKIMRNKQTLLSGSRSLILKQLGQEILLIKIKRYHM